MSGGYEVQLQISRQEDGLWRIEVPGLRGCRADAPTVEQAIADIQEVIAMAVDDSNENGWALPPTVSPLTEGPVRATLPVAISEFGFARPKPRGRRAKQPVR